MARFDKETQVAVIGGGPGGYAAAFLAADLGVRTTLIDPAPDPGGVCLYRGCIPSKVLLHAVGVMDEARLAGSWGVAFGKPEIDIERLRRWKDEIVGRHTRGLGELVRQRKIDYVRAKARFLSSTLIEATDDGGKKTTIAFNNAIVAAGTVPASPPGIDFSHPLVMDSTKALDLTDVPRSLLVIGAGFIGLELGSVYAGLGSVVTVVEMMPDIMPMVDADLARIYRKKADELFREFILGAVAELKPEGGGMKATFQDAGDKAKVVKEAVFDKVLVTVGRKPNLEGLGLENTKVKTDARGYIEVDAERRTADPAVFAVGDATGGPLLAHKATHEGRVAARVIAGRKAAYEPRAVPSVVYTDPEIAWCGLTEKEATAAGRKTAVARFPWAASGRAGTLGRPYGLTKLVIDPATERILGAGIVGTNAGELVGELALAVEMGAQAFDVAETIHPHPTLSETIMEAAQVYYGESTSVYRPKRE